MADDLLNRALDAARAGWHVFPCWPDDKIPRVADWPNVATTDLEQISSWWQDWPDSNIGLTTGRRSNVWVLDVDGTDGEETLEELERRFGGLPATMVSHTGKGRHFYFRYVDGVRNTARKLGKGLDTRGEGGYVLLPPSRHPNGRTYEWTPGTTPLAAAPDWLVELVLATPEGPPMAGEAATIAEDGAVIESGQRNATLTSLAGAMRRRGMETSEIEAALTAVNERRVRPQLPTDEIARIARSVGRYLPEEDQSVPQRRKRPLVQRVDVVTQEYIEFARNPQGRTRLGWEGLDTRLRGGLAPGELAVLAAAPYSGKTTLMANVGVNNPTTPMLFASIEMTLILVAARLFAMMAGEEYRTLEERLKRGNRQLVQRVLREAGEGLPLFGLMGVGGPSVDTLRRGVHEYQDEFQLTPKLVMVDYLDLMAPPSQGVEAVKQKLVDLRQLAKDEELAVLVAHQLKREAYNIRPGQPLEFTDTRYAGETEADHLIGLFRRINDPAVQNSQRLLEQHRHTVNYQVLKTRSDETVASMSFELGWDPRTLRITEPNGPVGNVMRKAAAYVMEDDKQEVLWDD